jgi:hypothetical protein
MTRAPIDTMRVELWDQETTINRQRVPGSEGSAIGAQPHDCICNFFRYAYTPYRMPADHASCQFSIVKERAIRHRRLDHSRRYRVDADTLVGILKCRRFRQSDNAVLAGVMIKGTLPFIPVFSRSPARPVLQYSPC